MMAEGLASGRYTSLEPHCDGRKKIVSNKGERGNGGHRITSYVIHSGCNNRTSLRPPFLRPPLYFTPTSLHILVGVN